MPTFKERLEAIKQSPEWPRMEYARQQKKRYLLILIMPTLIPVYLIEKYIGHSSFIYLAPSIPIIISTILAERKARQKFGPADNK